MAGKTRAGTCREEAARYGWRRRMWDGVEWSGRASPRRCHLKRAQNEAWMVHAKALRQACEWQADSELG